MISRRDFMRGAAGACGLVAFGGGARAFAQPAPALLPPGAQHDGFWERCIRCDRCRSACPRNAIGVAKLEDGIVAARTPKMEFRIGWCDTCDGQWRCQQACPTAALGNVGSFRPERDKLGLAVVDPDKCQTYGISAKCGLTCVDACPADALSLDGEGRLVCNEAACWGCGACEYVCPANAYRNFDGSTGRGVNVVPLNVEGAPYER